MLTPALGLSDPVSAGVKLSQVAEVRDASQIQSALGGLAMSPKCQIIILWSREDNAFVAGVPQLPGSIADGKTYQEALPHAEEIVQELIEMARELGKPFPVLKG